MKRFKRYFITGLLVVVPLYITVYVLTFIVRVMDNVFNILPAFLRPDTYLPFRVPGLGIIMTVVGVSIVGLLVQNFIGRWFVRLADKFFVKIPFLSVVYNATKQFMETFFREGHRGFEKVVLLEFPRKGIYAMGFLTGDTSGELWKETGGDTLSVFLPTTPNPTSGYYIMVPKSEVKILDMNVEDAFKVIMTGGIVVPEHYTYKEGHEGTSLPDS
jgi:uncharacterized membrane protein